MKSKREKLQLTENLATEIIEENSAIESGIFISLLAYKYIKICNITREQFLNSLNNSLDILERKFKYIERSENDDIN